MKTLKIYNIIAVIIIVVLAFWLKKTLKELWETEVLLEQCSQRYYLEISKKDISK